MHPNLSAPIFGQIMVSTDSTGQGYSFIENKPVSVIGFASTASTYQPVKFINGKPRIASTPYGYDVSHGNFTGHTIFFKTGENLDIDAAEEDIWVVGGTYVFPPTTGIKMEVVSDSTADAATDIGCRSVRVGYLDSNYNEQSTTVTLNGTAAVETSASNIARINSFRVLSAGTNNTTVGIVSIRATADTPIYSQISSNMSRAQTPAFTAPASHAVYITDFSGSITNPSGGRSGAFKIKANWDDKSTSSVGGGDIFWSYVVVGCQDGDFSRSVQVPIRFPQKTDLRFMCKGDAGNADAITHCAYRGWMEDVS